MVVVRALRTPEHDRGDISGQILGQRISVARPAAVELEAPGGEAFSDLAGVGVAAVEDGDNPVRHCVCSSTSNGWIARKTARA